MHNDESIFVTNLSWGLDAQQQGNADPTVTRCRVLTV